MKFRLANLFDEKSPCLLCSLSWRCILLGQLMNNGCHHCPLLFDYMNRNLNFGFKIQRFLEYLFQRFTYSPSNLF